MTDERIGRYFWLSEFLRSDTATRKGLANLPGILAMQSIRNSLAPGMERVRNCLGQPVLITSGFRSPEVNAAIGGAASSQHCIGQAADFICPSFGTPRSVARHLMERANEIRFDQLIYEGTWVHISFVPGHPRGQVLTAHFPPHGGPATYTAGLQ